MNFKNLHTLSIAAILFFVGNTVAIAQEEIPTIPTEETPGGQAEDQGNYDFEFTIIDEILEQTVFAPFREDGILKDSSRAAYVINSNQMEAEGYRTVNEAIKYLPGVFSDGTTGGQLGAASGQLMRSGKTSQTLILLDGRPLNDVGWFGNFDLSKITVNSLDRIEVIPSGNSALYGSSAIGGVINLVTKKADFTPGTSFEVGAEVGSFGFNQESISIAHGAENFAVRLGYDRTFASNDFDYALDSIDFSGTRENAGVNINNLNFQAAGKLSDRHQLTFNALYLSKDIEIPGGVPVLTPGIFNSLTPNANQYSNSILLSLDLKSQLNEANTSRLDARIFADFNNDYYRNPDGFFSKGDDIERTSIGGQIQHSLQLTETQKLAYGLDYRHVDTNNLTIGSCVAYDLDFNCVDFSGKTLNYDESIDQTALFVNYSANLTPDITASLGLRQDFNSLEDGSFTSPSAGILWQAGKYTSLRANYARNFRVPNLIDLYYAPFGYSNPNLKPEISDNFDIGIDQKIGDRALLRLTYFNNTIDDAIVNGFTQPINVQKVRAQGLEAALNVQITPTIYAFANYTLNDSEILEDETSLNEGNELRYAGTNFGTIGIAYQQPQGLYLGLFLKHVGDRLPTEANIDPLPSYTNVDLRARYPINERVNLTASWENIFDDHYEVSPGYPGVGSRFQIGINAKFR